MNVSLYNLMFAHEALWHLEIVYCICCPLCISQRVGREPSPFFICICVLKAEKCSSVRLLYPGFGQMSPVSVLHGHGQRTLLGGNWAAPPAEQVTALAEMCESPDLG